jgi:hypothetical protein
VKPAPGDLVRIKPTKDIPGTRGHRFLVDRVTDQVVHAWQLERYGIAGKYRSFCLDSVEAVSA